MKVRDMWNAAGMTTLSWNRKLTRVQPSYEFPSTRRMPLGFIAFGPACIVERSDG